MSRLGDLINAVRTAYPKMPELRRGRGIKVLWSRPPLYLDDEAEVGGLPLKEFARPPGNVSVSEVRGIYENFIERFIVQDHKDPKKWLTQQLDLHPRIADWYFPNGLVSEQYVAALIWYMSHAKEVTGFTLTSSDCYVDINDLRVGIENRVYRSRFHNGVEATVYVDYETDLRNYEAFGRARASYDLGLATFWHDTYHIKDAAVRANVQMALRILFYKFGHLGRLTDYLYKGYSKVPKAGRGHVAVCRKLLDGIGSMPNPAPTIHKALYPHFLREDEIRELFGDRLIELAVAPDEAAGIALIVTWSNVLKSLIKQNLQEEEDE